MIDTDLAHEHLPPTAKALVELIGLPDTLNLVEKFGGRPMIFSKGCRTAGQKTFETVAKVVGEESATKLAIHFSAEEIDIPKCADALRAVRNNRWRAYFDEQTRLQKRSARAVIAELAVSPGGITHRKMWDILKRTSDPVRICPRDRQGRLF